ncbi:MAG: hypothetical protein OSB09_08475 [Planctomycetota bacterium]|nr:hypothetical protein [Planctomycetota bacterium]
MESTTDLPVDPGLRKSADGILVVEVQTESKVILFEGAAFDAEVAAFELGTSSAGRISLGQKSGVEAKGAHDLEMGHIIWADDGDSTALLDGDGTELSGVVVLNLLRDLMGSVAEGIEGIERILIERIYALLTETPLWKEQQ